MHAISFIPDDLSSTRFKHLFRIHRCIVISLDNTLYGNFRHRFYHLWNDFISSAFVLFVISF
ncbi:hypothetical protein CW304_28855 [Bacillus sp. UFRGS-B20]|nr:hypothetical protein CW304_28855 [Bacillus sp. UFRGS-B20]